MRRFRPSDPAALPAVLKAEVAAVLDRHAVGIAGGDADALPALRRELVAMLDAAERDPVGFVG